MSATTSLQNLSRVAVTAPWLRRIVETKTDVVPAIARLTMGLVMFPHGAQKLLGWFGGYGWSGTYGFLTTKLGVPGPFAALAIITEFFGALALILGIGTRVAALGIAGVMVVAIATVHLPVGFFMNWAGTQGGEGFEYHLLMLALAAIVILRGGGSASVDRKLV